MDFSEEYNKEQEEFALEVREWLDNNVPEGWVITRDPSKISYEQWQKRRELARKLGEKGWLYPEFPGEYGGGDLDMARCNVIRQEFAERAIGLPPHFDVGTLAITTILATGNEEGKKRFLPPILRGETVTWQLFTEPEAGTDASNQQTNALRAVRENDHFIINGGKIFVGGLHPPPDQFLLLTRSDLEAPRHENLAMFLAPANLPGVSILPLDLFTSAVYSQISGPTTDAGGGVKYQVFFDDVRVHESFLLGGDHDGWRMTNVALTAEHGGGGGGQGKRVAPGGKITRNYIAEKFLDQCKNNPKINKRLKENPHLVERVVDTFISAKIEKSFRIRNLGGKGGRYGGPQSILYSKYFGARIIADIV